MSSIKQLIVNAIIKVSAANPALDREGEPTAEEARDAFIKALLVELFPEDSSVPSVTVPVTTESEPKKEKKKRAPKKKEEPAAAEPAAEPAPEPKKSLGKLAAMPVSDASSNAAAGAGGAAEPAPVKEKKPRKPKAEKPAEGANLAKIDPTWRKHLKNADKEHAKELEPELLKYLNALSKEEFDGKKAEEHVTAFLAARVAPKTADDDKVEADLAVVEFNGKDYYVNPETKRVYEGEGECDADGNWTSYKGIGYVGMAAFAEMKMEE